MAFPKLVPQSENLQRIPNPSDFALDSVVDTIFSGTVNHFRDFVEEGYYPDRWDDDYDKRDDGSRVLDYARNQMFHPETDTTAIESKQEMLTAFMSSPELIKLIQDTTIRRTPEYRDDWSGRFSDRIDRTQGLVDYVTELSQKLPKSANPQLETFRQYVVELATEGEKLQSLRDSLTDIEKAGTLEVKTEFLGKTDYFDKKKTNFEMENTSVEGTLASGKQKNTYDSMDRWNSSKLDIPYKAMFAEALEQVKAKGGRNLVSWEQPAELEIQVDQNSGTVTGKATYHKLDLVGTILSFKKKTTAVETDIDFAPETVTADSFSKAMKYLKSEEYSDFLNGFNSEIKEFAEAVVELRYMATVAGYFNELKEQGVDITMPRIGSMDSKRTQATNLIEPNLIGKVELGDIVANDVKADSKGNLYAITGPNNNGKTTYMNAVGIAQAMSQAGMMVLAQDAEISPKDNIFTHYIRAGDLVAGESRYAHELSRIKSIFKKATGYSLLLMDEPCSGTSPEDARQEADVVFKTTGDLGATGYVATHFHNLIETANNLPFAGNLHCVAHNEGDDLVYTFKIAEGSSNQSNGMYLARKMGADQAGLTGILNERTEKENLKLR